MTLYPGVPMIYAFVNTAYRRVRPNILATIHQTGNPRLPSATSEAKLTLDPSWGASATFYVNRDGSFVQRLHPELHVPFTNGSWNRPNTTLATVRWAMERGIGANDSTFITIENVAYEPGYPLTVAQIRTNAKILVWGKARFRAYYGVDMPIRRDTVLGHRDYNSVTRYYCPTGGDLNGLLGKITTQANQLLTPSQSTGAFPVRFDSVNKWGTLHPGVNVRTGPGTNYPIAYTTKAAFGTSASKRWIMGWVPGQLYNGSYDWGMWWSPNTKTSDRYDGRPLYAHRSLITF